MPKLDPKYVGKLPPGAAADFKQSLREYRELEKQGFLIGVKILSGPGCAPSEAQEGTVYQVASVPSLPLKGCTRAPCCACCYAAVAK
jgi:hypothetical protein